MQLPDGKRLGNGVVIGAFPTGTSMPEEDTASPEHAALETAVAKIRRQLGLNIRLATATGQVVVVRHTTTSRHFTAGPGGTVIRVRRGEGAIVAPGWTFIRYGFWAYIPPGVEYWFEGQEADQHPGAPDLRIIHADLVA